MRDHLLFDDIVCSLVVAGYTVHLAQLVWECLKGDPAESGWTWKNTVSPSHVTELITSIGLEWFFVLRLLAESSLKSRLCKLAALFWNAEALFLRGGRLSASMLDFCQA